MTEATTTIEPASADKPAPRSATRRMAREPNLPQQTATASAETEAKAQPPSEPKEPRGPSKIASVIALLERDQGAILAELVEATGWLPHTTRAALTGLKKKGHTIAKDKRGDVTCYHIGKAA
ncbi:DUF3489 domain-containing protein [Novosphingobium sp. Gsoil 351]|uniref:DUF3489 domain-containing protein n=1 Tax=Novosphingobium sp. Gsoil 351 TaxID=2675225 RepID=UPI0012B458E7|nr:DUF3489 domain-containing protein [Novosphingobium sp. Gsoil 351]QGN55051.1 DUF3489 domain-containing protein [Novosphingobium sp. Gsoil 351]